MSLQMHREKDETSLLYDRRLRLWVVPSQDELGERIIERGESWRAKPGTVHPIEV